MSHRVIIDTNILVRYFRQDDPQLSLKAKEIFEQAQKGKKLIYLDEIVKASQSLGILTSSSLIFISLLIALFHLGFYSLIIYFVYKNKDYFNKT